MIVGLCVAVVNKGKPELEGVDVGARRPALLQPRERLAQRRSVLAVAVGVDPFPDVQLDAGGRLEWLEARALKAARQALLAVGAGDIGDPLIVCEEAERLREARGEELAVDFAVALLLRLSLEVRLHLVADEVSVLVHDAHDRAVELRRGAGAWLRVFVRDALEGLT
jgi:hypothetical protein